MHPARAGGDDHRLYPVLLGPFAVRYGTTAKGDTDLGFINRYLTGNYCVIKPGYITKGWRYSHPLAFEQHRRTTMLFSGFVLLSLGWLDNITGYEFGFFIFYFIPVAIAAWYGGRKEGIVMAVCAAICWYISDRLTLHPYSRAYFIYWETFMRLISFLTTGLTLSRIRDLVLNEEKLLADLVAAQDELHHYRKSGPHRN